MAARAKNGRFASKKEVERRSNLSESAKLYNEEVRRKKALSKEELERERLHSVGSRVVDLAVLADGLWCKVCKAPLSLRNLEREVHRGLASILRIRCVTCLDLVRVDTSKSVRVPKSKYPLWSVNMKAATGTLTALFLRARLVWLVPRTSMCSVGNLTCTLQCFDCLCACF